MEHMDILKKNYTGKSASLLCLIGKTDRHDDPDHAQVTQLQSDSSLLNLLKCRSIKVLGVQLLLMFMLNAQATSKQVRKLIIVVAYIDFMSVQNYHYVYYM